MTEPDSPEEFNPFKGMPIFGDLGKLFSQQASSTWETARQFAVAVATEGQSEPNVDPSDRMALEELGRVAELQVANATGLSTTRDGQAATIVPVTRTQWATATLEAYQHLLEPIGDVSGRVGAEEAAFDPAQAMFGQIMKMIGPVMLSMTAGSMVGNLARRSMGQYDLPIPRSGSTLMVVPANMDALADEWSLDASDLRLWVCLSELTHHAVLSIPHVSRRLDELLADYVRGFEADPAALESRLGELDFANPESMGDIQSVLGDPEIILGAIQSPAQRVLLPQITALVTVIAGYVDWTMDSIGRGLIGSYQRLSEALRRRRVTADQADRFIERMFGLELTQDQYDRGSAFASGVLERAGTDGLARLWHSERELPTPAEVDAPGLWLARIDLPD
ncbi:MAG: zinc-dependent metalloprotease [Acidimicrobiia bacterium]|nr:zinc-dependent metalloprotease [Acidimicrobiia bacterium]MYL08152.1 zinc-dependent metalloprotease [Acidimicrobiia bacterium]